MIELYWHALKSYELDRISAACEYLVANRPTSFFPNPAEIKEALRNLPPPQHQQIPETTTITPEEQAKANNRLAFYIFESKRHRLGIHPDDVKAWLILMEEFRLEHDIPDERAAELIAKRRSDGYSNRRQYPHLYDDENLYVQFGKWATRKNKRYGLGLSKESYLPIIREYITDEGIKDQESMEKLIKILSTKKAEPLL